MSASRGAQLGDDASPSGEVQTPEHYKKCSGRVQYNSAGQVLSYCTIAKQCTRLA